MEGTPPERRRILSLEDAAMAFQLRLEIFPELMREMNTLSAGNVGVLLAIRETVTDELSYDPMEETTPQRLRSMVNAPEDDSELEQWRENFWDQFKAAKKID